VGKFYELYHHQDDKTALSFGLAAYAHKSVWGAIWLSGAA